MSNKKTGIFVRTLFIIAVIISLILTCSSCKTNVLIHLVDQNGNDIGVPAANSEAASDAVPVDSQPAVQPTEAPTEAPKPSAVSASLNAPISLPFAEITFTETGVKESMAQSITSGIVTRHIGPEGESGKKYVYLNGVIKNPGKEELPVYDFFLGEFDLDGYKFKCSTNDAFVYDEEGNHESKVPPLGSYRFFICVAVSNELADSFAHGTFRFGFYDNFDNHELSANRAFEDDPVSLCQYQYIITIK